MLLNYICVLTGISVWNKELLYVGGFLARSAYEIEMLSIRDLWNGAAQTTTGGKDGVFLPDEQLQKWLRDRCIHALKFFAFHTSTPSAVVSNLLESGFFSCAAGSRGSKQSFLIMSTTGVCDITEMGLSLVRGLSIGNSRYMWSHHE